MELVNENELCFPLNNFSNHKLFSSNPGIVRGIDLTTEKLYLLSSIPFEELQNVNVLAIGAIPLPTAVLLNQHTHIRGTIPYVYNTDSFVGSKQVSQHIRRSNKNTINNHIVIMDEN